MTADLYEHVMYMEIPGRDSFIHRNSMSVISSDVITSDVSSESTVHKVSAQYLSPHPGTPSGPGE